MPGLQVDLSTVAGVVAIGHDSDPTSGVKLNAEGRTILTGFGGDDRIYVDRAAGHAENDLSVDEITFNQNEGQYTVLQFSGGENMAGVLITFADNPLTQGFDESLHRAIAFEDTVGMGPEEYSFAALTGNGQPVIGG